LSTLDTEPKRQNFVTSDGVEALVKAVVGFLVYC